MTTAFTWDHLGRLFRGSLRAKSTGQRRKCTEIQKAGTEEAAAGSKLGCQGRKWLRYREHTGYTEDMCALLQTTGVIDVVRKWHS